MRIHCLFLAALGALFSSAGCVMSRAMKEKNLPPDWIAALPKPGSPVGDVAGVFVERGEQLNARYTRDGIVRSVSFSNLISLIFLDEAEGPRRQPVRCDTVELRRIDATHLELIARTNGEVTGRFTHEVEFEKDTGTMVLRGGKTFTSGKALAAIHTTLTLRFWRAADGRLYVHNTSRSVGGILLVVPTLLSTEVWSRWDPVTPEALQKHADALAKQAANPSPSDP